MIVLTAQSDNFPR